MPRLETLWIKFKFSLPSHEHWDTAIITHVTLPNLYVFQFQGDDEYLESLCARMTAPILSIFHVDFLQPPFGVPRPHLLSFMQKSKLPQFHVVSLTCNADRYIYLLGYSLPRPSMKCPSGLQIQCRYLETQVWSATQILHELSPVLSVVEEVTLCMISKSSEWHNEVNRTQWRGLLRTFSNVKVLRVWAEDVVGYGFGHSLRTEDGEHPLELLPNLEEVRYFGSEDENAFTPFINEREAVGRPVRLTRSPDILRLL